MSSSGFTLVLGSCPQGFHDRTESQPWLLRPWQKKAFVREIRVLGDVAMEPDLSCSGVQFSDQKVALEKAKMTVPATCNCEEVEEVVSEVLVCSATFLPPLAADRTAPQLSPVLGDLIKLPSKVHRGST